MSQENGERLIRSMYETFNAEGVNAAIERFCDPRVEYHDDPRWPGGGAYRGRDAVLARFQEVISALGVTEAEVDRVVDSGDGLAWIVRFRGESTGAGVPTDHAWGYTGRISEGRLVSFRAYYDPEDALEAAGLSE